MLTDPYVTLELHHTRARELRADAARGRRARQVRRHAAEARDDGRRANERWWSRHRAPAVS
jgi:hypothetical protein